MQKWKLKNKKNKKNWLHIFRVTSKYILKTRSHAALAPLELST